MSHNLFGVLIPFLFHDHLAAFQDVIAGLVGLAFGIHAYYNRLGGWAFGGVLILFGAAVNMCPGNEGAAISLFGAFIVGSAGASMLIKPRVRRSPRASRWMDFLGYGRRREAKIDEEIADFWEKVYSTPPNSGADSCSTSHDSDKATTMPTGGELYARLGVNRSATKLDLKRAYRALLRNCHPDYFPGDKHKESLAKSYNEAYEVLSDDHRRADYDRLN